MKTRHLLIIALAPIAGCGLSTKHVYSPDKKQCITFFNLHEFRYIVPGNVQSVPATNYVKLSLDPMIAENDEFAGCWNKNGYEWQGFIEGAKILENKLDTTKYKFSNKMPVDSVVGIPDYKAFSRGSCFHFGFSRFIPLPSNGAIIE